MVRREPVAIATIKEYVHPTASWTQVSQDRAEGTGISYTLLEFQS